MAHPDPATLTQAQRQQWKRRWMTVGIRKRLVERLRARSPSPVGPRVAAMVREALSYPPEDTDDLWESKNSPIERGTTAQDWTRIVLPREIAENLRERHPYRSLASTIESLVIVGLSTDA